MLEELVQRVFEGAAFAPSWDPLHVEFVVLDEAATCHCCRRKKRQRIEHLLLRQVYLLALIRHRDDGSTEKNAL